MNPLSRALAIAATMSCLSANAAAGIYDLRYPLIDDGGRSLTLGGWKGKAAIVTMEYANCRFLCSITLQRLKDVQAAADRQKKDFSILVLSLDPTNDRPEEWTRYRQSRGLDRSNWHFLTASVPDTPLLARTLKINYWVSEGHIMHDFRLLRLDERGNVVKVMDTFDADIDAFVR